MWGRTLGRAAIAVALMWTSGCDGDAPSDAGPGASDAGAESDAGAPIDVTSAEFVATSTSGDGPWGLWGFLVAPLDDSSAIVIGGTDAGGVGMTVYDSAWRVSVAPDGTLSATRIADTGPAPRYCGCAAYDAARDRVVVYGGRDLMVPALPTGTWELDLSNDTWVEVASANQPMGTLGCAMAYSPEADRTYLFGGANTGTAYDQTFRYDPTAGSWVEITGAGPVARYDAVFFPSHDNNNLMLFGGSFGAMGSAFYADLWRFDVGTETWTEIALPDGPEGRRTAWLVRDPDRLGLYVAFGYDGRMQPMNDMHYADLEALTWTPVEIDFDTGPVGRGFSFALPGGEGALGTVMAGYGSSMPIDTYWRLVR